MMKIARKGGGGEFMTSFTFEDQLVTMAQGFAVGKQNPLIVLWYNMLSLVTEPHWSAVAYRLQEGSSKLHS